MYKNIRSKNGTVKVLVVYNNIMKRDIVTILKFHNNNISTGASMELKDDKITFFINGTVPYFVTDDHFKIIS